MVDILKLKTRYFELNGDCDPIVVKSWIKQALRRDNTTAERFMGVLNSVAGFQYVGKELFTRIKEDYNLIYDTTTSYMWTITLTGRRVELREKVVEAHRHRAGRAWNTLFLVAFSKS